MIVKVRTWPPPGFALQQPRVSPNPKSVGEPVKSLSSQVTNMTEFGPHARDEVISPTVFARKLSPALISSCSFEKIASVG